jgi:limonene-1,2-epoxide hydrolase
MKKEVQQFVEYFQDLTKSNSENLKSFYHPEVEFKDPIHSISGIEKLSGYFEKLNKNVKDGGFNFSKIIDNNDEIILLWSMNINTIKPAMHVYAEGVSVLKLEHGKIKKHRDYFDAGQMFYENIPILKSVIKLIKNKLIK